MTDKILDALIAARVPTDVILAVAKLIADAEVTQDRRQKNRDRMFNVRARAHTRLHTETHGNTPPQHIDPPQDTEIPKKVSLSARKRLLPGDWQPDLEFAVKKGWTPEKVGAETQRFKDHAAATGRRQLDWDAAWRNWVTSPFQKPESTNGHAIMDRKFQRKERVTNAIDALTQFAFGENEPRDGGPVDQGPPIGLPHPRPSRP
jgi:hypothetical protein